MGLNLLTWKFWCYAHVCLPRVRMVPLQSASSSLIWPKPHVSFILLFSESFDCDQLRERLLGDHLALTIKMPPNGILGFSSNFGLLFIFYSHRQLALLFTFSKTQILCRSHSLFEMCVEERDNAHRLCSESFGTMIVSSLTLNFAWIGSYFPYF